MGAALAKKGGGPASAGFLMIALSLIAPSKLNPRKSFDEGHLAELAASIKEKGVLQPIVVRPIGDSYELVAGERRFRASLAAGLEDIPAMVRELDDGQVLEIMVIENAQRADVHPLEEAAAFEQLIKEHGHDIDSIAARIGKTLPYVKGRLALCSLTGDSREALLNGILPLGHAQIIARVPNDQDRVLAAAGIVRKSDKQLGIMESYPSNGRLVTLNDLKNWIKRELVLNMSRAPWSLDDAELIPRKAGACAQCLKRTGVNELLFPELGEDVCTDPKCWELKKAAWLERRIEEGKASGLTLLSQQWASKKKPPHGALVHDNWSEPWRVEDKADAVKGLVIETGEEVLYKPSSRKTDPDEIAKQQAERELNTKVESTYRPLAYSAVLAKVATCPGPLPLLIRMACIELFISLSAESYQRTVCKALGIKVPKDLKAVEAFKAAEFDSVVALTAIAFHQGVNDSYGHWTRIDGFAEYVGVDLDAVRKEAFATVTAPKPEKPKKGKKPAED